MSPNRALRATPSARQSTGSAMGGESLLRGAGSGTRGRDVALRDVGAVAEEVLFHLAREVLACACVGQIQAVLVDQHRLVAQPCGPGLLADVFPDAFAQFARIGREIKAFGFLAELDALDHACHLYMPLSA